VVAAFGHAGKMSAFGVRRALPQRYRLSDFNDIVDPFCGRVMSRTLVEIPDELLAEARRIVGPGASKAATVRLALSEMVRRHRQLEALQWFADSDALGDLNDASVRSRARS